MYGKARIIPDILEGRALFVDLLIHQFSRFLMENKTKIDLKLVLFFNIFAFQGGPGPLAPLIDPCQSSLQQRWQLLLKIEKGDVYFNIFLAV